MCDGKTNIYVNDVLFNQCKFLLLEIPVNKVRSFDEVESIDEAAEKLDRSLERTNRNSSIIPPEVEFWGHCSNMQVWAEYNYDTRLLHSNLAFPLLKKLYDSGDSVAERVFSDEIIKRLKSGHSSVCRFLEEGGYSKYIDEEYPFKFFRGTLIPTVEAEALSSAEREIHDSFQLVDKFRSYEEVLEGWWDQPTSFYVKDGKVEGIAIMDPSYCEFCFSNKDKQIEYGNIIPGDSECCFDCGFNEIPTSLLDIGHLKELLIKCNSFFRHDLPNWIQEITTLETLYLNAIGSDESILILGKLTNLKILVINNCYLRTLPSIIAKLKNLRILDLRDCSLNQISEEIGQLAQLEYLYLDENNIEELPISISQFEHLLVLSIKKEGRHAYNLKSFPDSICKIHSLKELYLDGNSIDHIPNSIGELTNLEVLSLNNTKLTSLPEKIGDCKNLKVVNLKNCNLTSLPESITQLTRLETLDIEGNILSGVSQKTAQYLLEFGMITEKDAIYLQMDKVHSEVLNEIEAEYKIKLKLVDKLSKKDVFDFLTVVPRGNEYIIKDNKIVTLRLSTKEMPKSICKLKSLKKLEYFGRIPSIPSFLCELTNLESLSLRGNDIVEISNLENLVNLKELDLSYNQLTKIKGLDALTSLVTLNFENNKIKEIKNLDSLQSLERLYLDDNKITEIKGLENLTRLFRLELSHNQIEDIKGLENLTNLSYFNFFKNNIPKALLDEIGKNGEKYVQYCQRKVVESQDLNPEHVTFKGKKFYVWNKILRIKQEGVVSIDEIKGLENIKDILVLDLSNNKIEEIKKLDIFTNLKKLRLNSNEIEEIKGLDSLKNLEYLNLSSNKILEIKGLQSLKNLKELYINGYSIPYLKNLGHLNKLENISILLSVRCWNNIQNLLEKDFHWVEYLNSINFRNVEKVREFCKIKDKKLKTTDLKLENILKVLSDKREYTANQIAEILKRKDRWDTEVIEEILWTHKDKFLRKSSWCDLFWRLPS